MTCECYKIGGRFIAEDPDCQVHGTEAQAEERRISRALTVTFEEYLHNLDEDELCDIMAPFKSGDAMAFAAAAFEAGKKVGR